MQINNIARLLTEYECLLKITKDLILVIFKGYL